jgi:small subunit ribosomal protein S20
MPQHKSAEKRVVTNEKRRLRNVAVRSEVKTVTKKLRSAEKDALTPALKAAHSALDKAAKKGVIARRTAARRKSRLAKHANRVAAKA